MCAVVWILLLSVVILGISAKNLYAQTAILPGNSPATALPELAAPPPPAPIPAAPAADNKTPKTDAPHVDKKDASKDTPKPDDKDQKIVNNPFTPGGVTTRAKNISREDVEKLLSEQETRLKKEFGSNSVTQSDIAKLVADAAGGPIMHNPDNFIGCVNGVPIYRMDDGTLSLGTKEAEEVKAARCNK